MGIVVVGLSHKTSPVELREKLCIPREELLASLNQIKLKGNLDETVILSTCNRLEIYGRPHTDRKTSLELTEHFFSSLFGVHNIEKSLYRYEAENAVSHLFRVAAGLDSLVVGETEILGQVKEAYHNARDCGGTGKITNVLFQRAMFIGKKVRNQTSLSEGASSVGSVAVHLAAQIFSSLKDQRVLIVGAGDMAEITARHFKSQKVGSLTILNRNVERAKELADKLGGTYGSLDQLKKELKRADIVLTSTSAENFLVAQSEVEELMVKRNNKSLYFIDISVPRNIDPAIHSIDNAYVYNIDDLKGLVDESLNQRKEEVGAAEKIVSEAAREFYQWVQSTIEGRGTALRHNNSAKATE